MDNCIFIELGPRWEFHLPHGLSELSQHGYLIPLSHREGAWDFEQMHASRLGCHVCFDPGFSRRIYDEDPAFPLQIASPLRDLDQREAVT